MLNISICLNISGYISLKLSKAFYTSDVNSFELDGDRSTVNGNSMMISTTEQEM